VFWLAARLPLDNLDLKLLPAHFPALFSLIGSIGDSITFTHTSCTVYSNTFSFFLLFMSPWQICTPDLVVFLACANHRLKERLEKRAEQQGRPDDNPKATERRLTNFKQNSIPLVKYFQERGPIVTVTIKERTKERSNRKLLLFICVCVCITLSMYVCV